MGAALRFDLKKNILSAPFLLGTGALFLLMLMTSCTVFNGNADQPNYNYIQFLIYADRDEMMSTYLYSDICMFIRGFGGEWTAVFLPMLAGLACVPMLCDEVNSNNFRLCVTRSGRRRYILSKLTAALITAVLMIVAVTVIFGLFCLIAFPSPQEYLYGLEGKQLEAVRNSLSFSEYPLNALFGSRSRALVVLSRLITLSLYSAVPCMLSMIMCALTLNKFVSLSVPVMLYFAVRQLAVSAVQSAYEEMRDLPKLWFFEVRERFMYGETQFEEIMHLPTVWFYVYPIAVLFLLGVLFYRLMKRRVSV